MTYHIPPQLIKDIINGKCIIFAGAGLSMGAKLPSWHKLLRILFEELEGSGQVNRSILDDIEVAIEDKDLIDAADMIFDELGKNAFARIIKDRFNDPKISVQEAHRLIAQLPFALGLTTNYDTLLERAYDTRNVYTQNQTPELSMALREDDFYIVKCHGDINDIETVVLTAKHYDKLMYSTPAYSQYISTLFLTKTVLFVGFSLNDPDFDLFMKKIYTTFEGYTATHYALMLSDEVKQHKIRKFRKQNIQIITYDDYAEVKDFFQDLVNAMPNKPQSEKVIWDKSKSPFPGLLAFQEEDAPIYFGRDYESMKLFNQLQQQQFVMVIGASGSGKSSLVGAGLVPLLREQYGEKLRVIRIFPSDNPFKGLVNHELVKSIDGLDMMELINNQADIIKQLHDLATASNERILIFVDQFEEIFTSTVDEKLRNDFITMLKGATDCVRVVVTMRADFYHSATKYFEHELNTAQLTLAQPSYSALREMIIRPAEMIDLTFEGANNRYRPLVDRILDDTGNEPGNLPLMAYALEELYKLDDDKYLTHDEYNALGGVQGAIGTRAENLFIELKMDDSVIQEVFHAMVEVDEYGTATRRRKQFQPDAVSENVRDLIHAFIDARLLTTNYDDHAETAIVEVAHEAILRQWKRLVDWIEDAQEELILLRQVKTAAAEWLRQEQSDTFRWTHERLEPVYAMIERLHPELSETEQSFIEHEQERLYKELQIITTTHQRRYDIGERLARIGDTRDGIGTKDGQPNMLWLPVNGSSGKQKFDFGKFEISDFFIAKYLATKAQIDAFLDSEWDNRKWWKGFPKKYQPQNFSNVTNGNSNAPQDSISWYQSIAFGRWMTEQFIGLKLKHPSGNVLQIGENAQIRIPTEWEWQWVAMNGRDERDYPWGEWDKHPRANTTESGIQDRSTAVGMYPSGRTGCGALDMAGNLWEWCVNNHRKPKIIDSSNTSYKVLKGGSFYQNKNLASMSYRLNNPPDNNGSRRGCRLAVAPILQRI